MTTNEQPLPDTSPQTVRRRAQRTKARRAAGTAPAALALPDADELARQRPRDVRVRPAGGTRAYSCEVEYAGRTSGGHMEWRVVPPAMLGGRIPEGAEVEFSRLPAGSRIVYVSE